MEALKVCSCTISMPPLPSMMRDTIGPAQLCNKD